MTEQTLCRDLITNQTVCKIYRYSDYITHGYYILLTNGVRILTLKNSYQQYAFVPPKYTGRLIEYITAKNNMEAIRIYVKKYNLQNAKI